MFKSIIALSFQEQTHICEKHYFGWRERATWTAYVSLSRGVDGYAVELDNDGFEML